MLEQERRYVYLFKLFLLFVSPWSPRSLEPILLWSLGLASIFPIGTLAGFCTDHFNNVLLLLANTPGCLSLGVTRSMFPGPSVIGLESLGSLYW
ncbi:hypothetical protein K435DRAFT_973629, partial [Dendrothele bispora CBS 962.96]